MSLEISEADGAFRFRVRATPRARGSAIVGVVDGVLSIRIAAPPVEGKANQAICSFLAERLSIRVSAVRICGGERSRHKVVEVRGLEKDAILARLLGEARPRTPGEGTPGGSRECP